MTTAAPQKPRLCLMFSQALMCDQPECANGCRYEIAAPAAAPTASTMDRAGVPICAAPDAAPAAPARHVYAFGAHDVAAPAAPAPDADGLVRRLRWVQREHIEQSDLIAAADLIEQQAREIAAKDAEILRLQHEVSNRNRRALDGDDAVKALANVHDYYEDQGSKLDAARAAIAAADEVGARYALIRAREGKPCHSLDKYLAARDAMGEK